MMKFLQLTLTFVILLGFAARIPAQDNSRAAKRSEQSFEKIEMLVPDGEKLREVAVRVRFEADRMIIEAPKTNENFKTFNYAELKSAEYSYSKKPRWKTGLGLTAAGFLFPPLWFVSVPLGFTKHRRHWLTIRGENDYAVLKLSKSNRKVFIPAFETESKLKVEALGESK